MKKLLLIGIILLTTNKGFSQVESLDASFGVDGKVITSINNGADIAYAVSLQQDGKIVVGGMTLSSTTGKDFACLRYNLDGTLDSSFGTNGIVTIDIQVGSEDVAYSLAIQNDGKIVLAGYSDDGTNKNAALIRLNSDGSLDTTFGTSGVVLTDFIANRYDEIKTVKIHTLSGNIIVGGTSSLTSTNSQAVIARYTSTGLLDTTFNSTGKVLLDDVSGVGTYFNIIEDLDVKSNGKISAVGWINQQGLSWSSNYYACRLNSNGTMDTTFSTDGYLVTNGGFNGEDKAFSMILNSDDSFLYSGGGYLSTLQYDYFLGLCNPTGTNASGKASFDYGPLVKDIAYGMGVDSTGKIVLAGSNVISSTSSTFGLARVNANYSVDSTFGNAGKVTTTFGTNTKNEAFDMVIQSDDKIIAVGYTDNDIAIARYNSVTTLSNAEFEFNNKIVLYPNPVVNVLNVDLLDNLIDSKESFNIIDVNGRVVLNGTLTDGVNQINVENLTQGIYILKSKNINKKFIKK